MASHDPLQGFREDSKRAWERKRNTRRIVSIVFQAGLVAIVWLLSSFMPSTLQLGILATVLALFGLSGPWLLWLLTEDFRRGDSSMLGWRTALSAVVALGFSAFMLFMAAAHALPLWSPS